MKQKQYLKQQSRMISIILIWFFNIFYTVQQQFQQQNFCICVLLDLTSQISKRMIKTQRNAIMRQKNNQNIASQKKIGCSVQQSGKQNTYHFDKKSSGVSNNVRNTYFLNKTSISPIKQQQVLREQNRSVSRSKSIKSQRNLKKYLQAEISTSLTAAPSMNSTLNLNYACSKFLLPEQQQQSRVQDKSKQRNSFSNYSYLKQVHNGGACLSSRLSARKDLQIGHKMQTQHILNMQSQIQCLLKVVHKKKDKQNTQQGKPRRQIKEEIQSKQSEDWGRGTTFTQKLNPYPFSNIQNSGILIEPTDKFDAQIYKDISEKYLKLTASTKQPKKIKQNIPNRKNTQFKYTQQSQIKSKVEAVSDVNFRDMRKKQMEKIKNSNPNPKIKPNLNLSLKSKPNGKIVNQQPEWIDLPEVNSSYIDVIDRQIQKIKGKIMDSERVTRLMESKYLNIKSSRNSQENKLESSIHSSVKSNSNEITITNSIIHTPKTPRLLSQFCFSKTFSKIDIQKQQIRQITQEQIIQSQQTQKKQQVQQKQTIQKPVIIEERNNESVQFKQLYNEMLINLAMTLSKQVELDIQMREWRQFAKIASELNTKKKIQKEQVDQKRMLWQGVIKILAKQGYHYTLFEIKDLLTVTSCQTNPLSTPQQSPRIQKIIQTLSQKFLQSQGYWHSQVIGSINRKQSEMCGFSLKILDLDKKGYISIQDVVCFVNLYAGKFYRNRDFVMMFRRILIANGKNLQNKKIQYQDIDSVMLDNR